MRFDGIAGFDCLHGTPRLIAQPKYQSNVNDLADGIISPSPSARAYCLAAAGGFASGSPTGAAPRSSAAGVQSPAQSLVPLTVPTNLQHRHLWFNLLCRLASLGRLGLSKGRCRKTNDHDQDRKRPPGHFAVEYITVHDRCSYREPPQQRLRLLPGDSETNRCIALHPAP